MISETAVSREPRPSRITFLRVVTFGNHPNEAVALQDRQGTDIFFCHQRDGLEDAIIR